MVKKTYRNKTTERKSLMGKVSEVLCPYQLDCKISNNLRTHCSKGYEDCQGYKFLNKYSDWRTMFI